MNIYRVWYGSQDMTMDRTDISAVSIAGAVRLAIEYARQHDLGRENPIVKVEQISDDYWTASEIKPPKGKGKGGKR